FFSSRRRHTRSYGDWSSGVCSSDLPEEVARAADLLGRRWALAILWAAAEAGAVRFNEFRQTLEGIPPRTLAARLNELEQAGVLRSEERRVGKERGCRRGRARWSIGR